MEVTLKLPLLSTGAGGDTQRPRTRISQRSGPPVIATKTAALGKKKRKQKPEVPTLPVPASLISCQRASLHPEHTEGQSSSGTSASFLADKNLCVFFSKHHLLSFQCGNHAKVIRSLGDISAFHKFKAQELYKGRIRWS